jgi:hypothetical protein
LKSNSIERIQSESINNKTYYDSEFVFCLTSSFFITHEVEKQMMASDKENEQ